MRIGKAHSTSEVSVTTSSSSEPMASPTPKTTSINCRGWLCMESSRCGTIPSRSFRFVPESRPTCQVHGAPSRGHALHPEILAIGLLNFVEWHLVPAHGNSPTLAMQMETAVCTMGTRIASILSVILCVVRAVADQVRNKLTFFRACTGIRLKFHSCSVVCVRRENSEVWATTVDQTSAKSAGSHGMRRMQPWMD